MRELGCRQMCPCVSIPSKILERPCVEMVGKGMNLCIDWIKDDIAPLNPNLVNVIVQSGVILTNIVDIPIAKIKNGYVSKDDY